MKHLLITNDFPPKRGGIQNYLYELWKGLDPSSFLVVTTRCGDQDESFDLRAEFPIVLLSVPLLPTPSLTRRIRALILREGIQFVVIDPTLPLGLLARNLGLPYVILAHGAEVIVPMKLPMLSTLTRYVLEGAAHVICSGSDVAREIREFTTLGNRKGPPVTFIPPGCDLDFFRPLSHVERVLAREELGIKPGELMVLFVSRLVPRKGADVLIRGLASQGGGKRAIRLFISGSGRDLKRLRRLAAKYEVNAEFFGSTRRSQLLKLYQSADIFSMLCRNRWFGLEREGFGIVFLEAQACAVPVVVGRSGGSVDALSTNTGVLVENPSRVSEVAGALDRLLNDDALRVRLGSACREWVEENFDYRELSTHLSNVLQEVSS